MIRLLPIGISCLEAMNGQIRGPSLISCHSNFPSFPFNSHPQKNWSGLLWLSPVCLLWASIQSPFWWLCRITDTSVTMSLSDPSHESQTNKWESLPPPNMSNSRFFLTFSCPLFTHNRNHLPFPQSTFFSCTLQSKLQLQAPWNIHVCAYFWESCPSPSFF